MPKPPLVSVVEDNQHFRGSRGKAHEIVGLQCRGFPVDSRFLASSRVVETVCLIADVHMPANDRVEFYRHPSMQATRLRLSSLLPTPDDIDRSRALNDGVVC